MNGKTNLNQILIEKSDEFSELIKLEKLTVETSLTANFKSFELSIEKRKEVLEILVTADGKIMVNKESGEEDELNKK